MDEQNNPTEQNPQPNQEIPQPPVVEVESSSNKLTLILSAVLVLILGIGVYLFLGNNDSPISNDTKEVVGPLTIERITPILVVDQPSSDYENSIIKITHQLGGVYGPEFDEINEMIRELDSEINSKNTNSHTILYVDKEKNIVLYLMTPTMFFCGPNEANDFSCENARLKILNTEDNSINFLTDKLINFGHETQYFYIDEKNDRIVIFNDKIYQIFNLNSPHSLVKSTPDGAYSSLSNEYVISYNPKTYDFSIENILSNKKIECVITNEKVRNALNNNFDPTLYYSYSRNLSMSPDGKKIALFQGHALENNSKFLWSDLSDQWSDDSQDCLNNAKEVELTVSSVFQFSMTGKWYSNARYVAVLDHLHGKFVYDFDKEEQIFYSPMGTNGPGPETEGLFGVGGVGNYGYSNTVSVDEVISRLTLVPGDGELLVYFEMPNGNNYLIGTYNDRSSTQEFYESTQRYPYGSDGNYTSRRLEGESPQTTATLVRDNMRENLYHLLIVSGRGHDYGVRQVVDVSVNKK